MTPQRTAIQRSSLFLLLLLAAACAPLDAVDQDSPVRHLELPLTRMEENRQTISLAFKHFPAQAPGKRIPVFIIAEEPGASTIDLMRLPGFATFVDDLRARRPVVLVDRRGGGHSRPAWVCNEREQDYLTGEPVIRDAHLRKVVAHYRAKKFVPEFRAVFNMLSSCVDRLKQRITHVNAVGPAEHAQDITDLADHLGYERIALLSFIFDGAQFKDRQPGFIQSITGFDLFASRSFYDVAFKPLVLAFSPERVDRAIVFQAKTISATAGFARLSEAASRMDAIEVIRTRTSDNEVTVRTGIKAGHLDALEPYMAMFGGPEIDHENPFPDIDDPIALYRYGLSRMSGTNVPASLLAIHQQRDWKQRKNLEDLIVNPPRATLHNAAGLIEGCHRGVAGIRRVLHAQNVDIGYRMPLEIPTRQRTLRQAESAICQHLGTFFDPAGYNAFSHFSETPTLRIKGYIELEFLPPPLPHPSDGTAPDTAQRFARATVNSFLLARSSESDFKTQLSVFLERDAPERGERTLPFQLRPRP